MQTETGFRKSSLCGSTSCVEVDDTRPGFVAMLDSKDPDGPVLIMTDEGWNGLIAHILEK